MNGNRRFPDEPAGPFPEPPQQFGIDDGRTVVIDRISLANGEVNEELIRMYEDFDSADRAQGIPPIGRREIEQWLELILDEGPDVVARVDNRAVGHATLVPDDAGAFELAIFVHQDFRGRGIGRTLLRTLLGNATATGIERVWLTVERWNTVAINLYESVGFERIDCGSFELEMTLRLDPHTARTG